MGGSGSLVADMDLPDDVVDGCAALAVAEIPVLLSRIPPAPAASLGRLGADEPPASGSPSPAMETMRRIALSKRSFAAPRPSGSYAAPRSAEPEEPSALAALRSWGPLPCERLLGALELTVAALGPAAPDLSAHLRPPMTTGFVAMARMSGSSGTVAAAELTERLRGGSCDLVVELARRLMAHPAVRPLPAGNASGGEETVAAGHGARHLAVAVVAARAVVDQGPWPDRAERAAAVVGLGIGAAVHLLREAPMPAAYAAAQLEKIRAEYLMPRGSYGSAPVAGHRFALVEGEVPETADFSGNGLVAVVDGGAVIRTGVADGSVPVEIEILAEPPPDVEDRWTDVVEVSWRAAQGSASLTGPHGPAEAHLRRVTPPWPGDYRLRVHARNRDEDYDEGYKLTVWAGPPAPEIVHRRFDLLGHRLRGEAVPQRAPRPDRAYAWVRNTRLDVAATVTVVTGATRDQVLCAFGANPRHQPERFRDLQLMSAGRDLGVAVLDTGDAVVAVEFNGFRGSREDVLRAVSVDGGRAASMYWNVRALTRLSFAENGRILAAFEPFGDDDPGAGPDVAAALAGLDFGGLGAKSALGLVAVERFTGHAFTATEFDTIEAGGVAYRTSADD